MQSSERRVLVLWDVDHTLIDNGGVSKENYALAFQKLTGSAAEFPARTDGRTDILIMRELLEAHNVSASSFTQSSQLAALAAAGAANRELLAGRGRALPGALAVVRRLAVDPQFINSVLTGNIQPNAFIKLDVFGLAEWIDFSVGAFGSESADRSRLVPVAQGKATAAGLFDPHRDATILFGDTVRDVAAGLEGGAQVIAVATGNSGIAKLLAAGADAALNDLRNQEAFFSTLDQVVATGPRHPPN